tara:strand:- start:601 stop:1434 length:834 start_codon:yes stop_codon:yes gene_type:complete
MSLNLIEAVILCPSCGGDLSVIEENIASSCCNKKFKVEDNQIVIFNNTIFSNTEARSRDKQAEGYLLHDKFPTQISILKRWISKISHQLLDGSVLDIGCGPGPSTRMLLESGARDILSVDFSINSLRINKDICKVYEHNPIYLLQDIRNLKLRRSSVSILLMADFLQHIIEKEARDNFLNEAMNSLIPGGYFFLSFFNINVKNYLSNDIFGSFSAGSIKYERLDYNEVISSFPDNIIVESVTPMNIFNNAFFDRWICAFPFAKFFSRMIVVKGRKKF